MHASVTQRSLTIQSISGKFIFCTITGATIVRPVAPVAWALVKDCWCCLLWQTLFSFESNKEQSGAVSLFICLVRYALCVGDCLQEVCAELWVGSTQLLFHLGQVLLSVVNNIDTIVWRIMACGGKDTVFQPLLLLCTLCWRRSLYLPSKSPQFITINCYSNRCMWAKSVSCAGEFGVVQCSLCRSSSELKGVEHFFPRENSCPHFAPPKLEWEV